MHIVSRYKDIIDIHLKLYESNEAPRPQTFLSSHEPPELRSAEATPLNQTKLDFTAQKWVTPTELNLIIVSYVVKNSESESFRALIKKIPAEPDFPLCAVKLSSDYTGDDNTSEYTAKDVISEILEICWY